MQVAKWMQVHYFTLWDLGWVIQVLLLRSPSISHKMGLTMVRISLVPLVKRIIHDRYSAQFRAGRCTQLMLAIIIMYAKHFAHFLAYRWGLIHSLFSPTSLLFLGPGGRVNGCHSFHSPPLILTGPKTLHSAQLGDLENRLFPQLKGPNIPWLLRCIWKKKQ